MIWIKGVVSTDTAPFLQNRVGDSCEVLSVYFTHPSLSQFFAWTVLLRLCALKNVIWISLKNLLSLHSRKGGIIHTGNASFIFIWLSMKYKSLFLLNTRDFVKTISNLFQIRLLTISKRLLIDFSAWDVRVNFS